MIHSRVTAIGLAVLALAASAVTGCRSERPATTSSAAPAATSAVSSAETSRAGEKVDPRPRVVFLGDSLTAGLGLSPDQAYPALIQQKIDDAGLKYPGGERGGVGRHVGRRPEPARLGARRRRPCAGRRARRQRRPARPSGRGAAAQPVDDRRAGAGARDRRRARRHGGAAELRRAYVVSFHQVYPDLAKRYGVPLIPFLLQDVAGVDGLNQRDGIHPTAEGARTVAENVWSVLRPTLKGS